MRWGLARKEMKGGKRDGGRRRKTDIPVPLKRGWVQFGWIKTR